MVVDRRASLVPSDGAVSNSHVAHNHPLLVYRYFTSRYLLLLGELKMVAGNEMGGGVIITYNRERRCELQLNRGFCAFAVKGDTRIYFNTCSLHSAPPPKEFCCKTFRE